MEAVVVRYPDFEFKKGWRLAWILTWLFPETIRQIIIEELTEALHPDFGWYVLEQEAKRNE